MRRLLNSSKYIAALVSVVSFLAQAQQAKLPQHLFFHVTLGSQFQQPVSGRLLLFVSPGSGEKAVDMSMMAPTKVYIAAREISHLLPGETVDIDADDGAFPGPLSQAAPGDYEAQVVLDVAHTYNYAGRQPGDLISDVVVLPAWNPQTQSSTTMTLTKTVPELPDPLANMPDPQAALQRIDFTSPVLSKFWGRKICMQAWVLLPPGYNSHPKANYPTVYFTHGFGGSMDEMRARFAPVFYQRMKNGKMPEMIWVLLDESSPTGTHEFADGVNNGPWGTALTTELIPYLETHYRMDARVSGRFLQGHSSGGWATLWLQTTYPKIFGGTWSTSPDPSDFHAFSTIDLYAPGANMYRRADGTPQPIIRMHGTVVATMEQMAHLETVLGDYGGQIGSFEWVFSPRGPDGRPLPMFNRATGAVDPKVIAYWGAHYDISQQIQSNWKTLAPDLRGKIHLYVGTEDTFYLNNAAHRLQALLDRLSAQAQVAFIPGRTHFDLYRQGSDPYALFDQIAAQMYAIARPAPQKN
jgi:S-formylglutathione hydrolase FrmB